MPCNAYIDALEAADDGDLDPLGTFTDHLHQHSITQAMSTREPDQ